MSLLGFGSTFTDIFIATEMDKKRKADESGIQSPYHPPFSPLSSKRHSCSPKTTSTPRFDEEEEYNIEEADEYDNLFTEKYDYEDEY